jgi:serine/threonine protein kinase
MSGHLGPSLHQLFERFELSDEARQAFVDLFQRSSAPKLTILPVVEPVLLRSEGGAGPLEALGQTGRYEDLGLLGVGGMGEVRRVRDPELNRTVALKLLRPGLKSSLASMTRFIQEAQIAAQLQHPGIVPVHELGVLEDGQLYFTMREIRGRGFDDVIREVHGASYDRFEPGPSGWTFHRLISAFHQVCTAVAYAHHRGVLHRDIKPENIVVGDFGEVQLIDWGLAKILDRPELGLPDEAVISERSRGAAATQVGTVHGTPAYMPPEQARGEVLDKRADVYALGAVLYQILAGRPPYLGGTAREVLRQVLAFEPELPGRVVASTWSLGGSAVEQPAGPPLPEDLVKTCMRAMSRDPAARPADAGALAAEVSAWLEAAHKRERAQELVARGVGCREEADAMRVRAYELREEATEALSELPSHSPWEQKIPLWALETRAEQLEIEAERKGVEGVQLLQEALVHDPELPEVHSQLSLWYQEMLGAAERTGDRLIARRAEAMAWAHAHALPEAHPDRERHASWLRGTAAVTLLTHPPGAQVWLYTYVRQDHRLVAVQQGLLGRTPLQAVTVPCGSHLLVLRHPSCEPVRYPVQLGRGELWEVKSPVYLPRLGELGEDCYAPAGWTRVGDQDTEFGTCLLPRRVLVYGLVAERFPVTLGRYQQFLQALCEEGQLDEALARAPRRNPSNSDDLILSQGPGGGFVLSEGWSPDHPVVNVSWEDAFAFSRWQARRTGLPWRLPNEIEWERLARGADGRRYPWGGEFDPGFCCAQDSRPPSGRPAPTASFPVDESPFGVRGLGGNVADICLEWGPGHPLGRVESFRPLSGETGERGGL